jgi:hypothetical protein
MNDLRRIELQDPLIKSRLSFAQASRKIAIFLAVLIASVMIIWFGFLGWGVIAILQWLLDCIKSFWTAYF